MAPPQDRRGWGQEQKEGSTLPPCKTNAGAGMFQTKKKKKTPWSRVLDLIGLSWHVSYVDIIMKNTNIAFGERYSKFFTELFILKLFRRPFPV
jgi:hypothetical protein